MYQGSSLFVFICSHILVRALLGTVDISIYCESMITDTKHVDDVVKQISVYH